MKNRIALLIMAIMLLPLTASAQDIFAKYSENPDVTYVSIKPKMFQMLAKMDINTDDPEAQEYLNMVNSITSFKTIVTDNAAISKDVVSWVKSRKSALSELMEVKDDGVEMKFYIKEGKDEDHVSEFLMFVNGLSKVTEGTNIEVNGKTRNFETVIVSLTGDIDLNQISKLTKKMNIPGGEHLEEKNKK
ncbi:hypothetical protein IA57_00870 [Mangrovimonas yunxiaonensis]|uniref:DNA topoisomerase IV subunit B n=1 Tax=Mangrovimonas yunxiaonensis TaxID=1197477 RepID=A0A084TND4_9FLAO|nr:DUF4252 domain-containing protein [Mangrovimonas yunxiaonensis]KFB02220.1 hypothetical protein IA57_00870 [Mangrovimonas yunxiaonensis]MBR9756579.1 DUF4252 domain-containing protein [Algicola sp.]